MKTTLISAILLFFVVTACHNDTKTALPAPPASLYKRWHFDRTKQSNDTVWMMNNTDGYYYDTEYRTDSTLVYRKDGVIVSEGCCSPDRFNLNGQMIDYYRQYTCPGVKCLTTSRATITQLTNNLLEIQIGNIVTQYIAVN